MGAKMEYAIETRNLTKTYGKNRGVRDVNLKVEKGDIFGYLGPNGAGKSTTIRTLLGMIYPKSGEAFVFGKKTGEEQREILRRTGYMPSETMFYPSMRAGEVIRYAAKMRGMDCDAEAKGLIARLGVDVNKRVSELSLGNRKKISIVCALQHNPELLIFDEPTSGLDPLIQEVFFELLLERNREGVTCFLSSHVLPEVRKYCKHAGIIREGKLVASDTVDNLIHTNIRQVRLVIAEQEVQMCEDAIKNMLGVADYSRSGREMKFAYQGEIAFLLRTIRSFKVEDMLLEEPSLEDVFMHFYM